MSNDMLIEIAKLRAQNAKLQAKVECMAMAMPTGEIRHGRKWSAIPKNYGGIQKYGIGKGGQSYAEINSVPELVGMTKADYLER